MSVVGSIERIFRFPVKSMGGEELREVFVSKGGLVGDRAYGVRALDTEHVLSAKREAALMRFSAHYEADTLAVFDPGGHRLEGSAVTVAVGQELGRPVELVHRSGSDDVTLEGEPIRAEPGEISRWKPPAGTFFDASSLHLISLTTLRSLRALDPDADFDPLRFRPNFVITSHEPEGFPEESWVGTRVRIGERLVVLVTKPCSRCVMTTHAQGDLPRDRSILETVARHNGNNAGIRATVETEGSVRVGDALVLV